MLKLLLLGFLEKKNHKMLCISDLSQSSKKYIILWSKHSGLSSFNFVLVTYTLCICSFYAAAAAVTLLLKSLVHHITAAASAQ